MKFAKNGLMTRCIATALLLCLFTCSHIEWRAHFHRPSNHAQIGPEATFLKCHTADGGVYILSSWKFAPQSGVILGTGLHYDKNRNLLEQDKQVIPYEQVILLETNQPRKVVEYERILTMGILTAASVVLSAVVLSNDFFF
jgi:hypothetical protein